MAKSHSIKRIRKPPNRSPESVKIKHKLEYASWRSVKTRCYNSNHEHWDLYGGKGIKLCERWKTSFWNFLEDMGPRPSPTHTLDRLDSNKDYEPGNCRWATREEQSQNRACVMYVTFQGITAPLSHWSRKLGLKTTNVKDRIMHGWSLEEALTTPKIPRDSLAKQITLNGKTKTIRQWAETLNIRPDLIHQRIANGWTVERAITTPNQYPNRKKGIKKRR